MDIDKEVKLLNVWIENTGGQFEAEKVKAFENKYLNELTKGTISEKFPKHVYVLLHLRAEQPTVEMTGEQSNNRKDIFELIFALGFSLYVAAATHIVVGVAVLILLFCWSYIKYMRNRQKILKEQIVAFNEHYARPKPSFSYKSSQASDDFASSQNDGQQSEYGFNQNKWNNKKNQEKGKATQQPYGLDLSRFKDKRMQEKYRKRQNITLDPNASPSERQSALKWMIAADNGEIEGIKPLLPSD